MDHLSRQQDVQQNKHTDSSVFYAFSSNAWTRHRTYPVLGTRCAHSIVRVAHVHFSSLVVSHFVQSVTMNARVIDLL